MNITASPAADAEATSTTAIEGLVIALAVVSVVLRFYVRITSKAGLGWDDWLIFSAVVATLTTGVLLLVATGIDANGASVAVTTDPKHVYLPRDHLYLQLSFASSVLYFTIVGSTKLSILLMYNRLFAVDAAFRRQLAVLSALVVAYWVGCTVANLTNCVPLAWTWRNALDDPRYCFNYNVFWMAAGACEVLLDVLILALPVRAVHRLQLSARKKATVTLVFFLGGFVVVTGIVKVILGYVPGAREPSYSRTEVWTTVHAGMAIVCASLPILKALLTRISRSALVSKLTSSSVRSHPYELRGWSAASRSRDRRSSSSITSARDDEESSETGLRDGHSPWREGKAATALIHTEEIRLPLGDSMI